MGTRRTVGVLLLAAGLFLSGYVMWGLYGTRYVAQAEQSDVVDTVRRTWETKGPGPVRTEFGDAYAIVRIPRFGDGYEVPVLRGVTDESLRVGYAHFDGTAAPGGRGNFALAAHRITYAEPLRRMPELRPGEQVIVETATHVYTYVLDSNDTRVGMDDVWVTGHSPRDPESDKPAFSGPRGITLSTCASLFHTTERDVAFGTLEASKAK